MLRLLGLLLPALIPSWRFFKSVAPSPRIEYRLIHSGAVGDWQPDRPRPDSVGFGQMLRRMLWNTAWNEQLYMVSLSERLIGQGTQHSVDEINDLLAKTVPRHGPDTALQFRLIFLSREGVRLVQTVLYESEPVALERLRA